MWQSGWSILYRLGRIGVPCQHPLPMCHHRAHFGRNNLHPAHNPILRQQMHQPRKTWRAATFAQFVQQKINARGNTHVQPKHLLHAQNRTLPIQNNKLDAIIALLTWTWLAVTVKPAYIEHPGDWPYCAMLAGVQSKRDTQEVIFYCFFWRNS